MNASQVPHVVIVVVDVVVAAAWSRLLLSLLVSAQITSFHLRTLAGLAPGLSTPDGTVKEVTKSKH